MTNKRKSIKKNKNIEKCNKLTKPRFFFTLFGMLFGIIYILVGIGMFLMVYDYEQAGLTAYGLISPALFSIAAGMFQISAFIFRSNKKLWKTCTLFSLICTIGIAISMCIIFGSVLNILGVFIGSTIFYLPIIICQLVILSTDIELHRKSLKEFNIERGKSNKLKNANNKIK